MMEPEMQCEKPTEGKLHYVCYTNDGSPDSIIALMALKNIFSKQLPKMPKEYIVRLVFDRRHVSMALLRDDTIIGGICYRPYFEQRFAEIAFCAVSGSEQVKGFGTMLMNNLKSIVQKQNLQYFLTYADNYAIGYFQKQGFTKYLTMPRERWVGYIKEYDGGTLMECYIHPAVNYFAIPQQLLRHSQASVMHAGLELFQEGRRLHSCIDAPGVTEAGWSASQVMPGQTDRDYHMSLTRQVASLRTMFDRVRNSDHSWPFLQPVDEKDAPGYYSVIRNPIDLGLIQQRLREGNASGNIEGIYYRTKDMLRADLMRMVRNCKVYNPPGSDYYIAAEKLEAVISDVFSDGENKKDDKKVSADE